MFKIEFEIHTSLTRPKRSGDEPADTSGTIRTEKSGEAVREGERRPPRLDPLLSGREPRRRVTVRRAVCRGRPWPSSRAEVTWPGGGETPAVHLETCSWGGCDSGLQIASAQNSSPFKAAFEAVDRYSEIIAFGSVGGNESKCQTQLRS